MAELAAAAVLDLFVPCLILEPKNIPSNLLGFAIFLAEQMDNTREQYGRPKLYSSPALRLASGLLGHPLPASVNSKSQVAINIVRVKIKKELAGDEAHVPIGYDGLIAAMVADTINEDIAALVADVRTVVPTVRAALVLIDDFHKYTGLEDLLLGHGVFGPHGLGGKEAPAPLILTYRSKDPVGESILKLLQNRAGARSVPLKAFEGHESRLAYGQYLRSRAVPLAVNTMRDQQQYVEGFFAELHGIIRGIPGQMEHPEATGLIRFASRANISFLLPADDEDILARRIEADLAYQAGGAP